MLSLISRWKLRNGCPPELATALQQVAATVLATEPTTLGYSVHIGAPNPLGTDGKPLDPPACPLPLDQQTEVVFFEIYKDAKAFADHINGSAFTAFLEANRHYFYEDPSNPSFPNTDNIYLHRQSAFFRPEAN